MSRLRWDKRVSRDSVLFVAGMGGIINETFFHNIERPTLLILFGAMVGLPVFLRTDESAHAQLKTKSEVQTTPEPPPDEAKKP